MNFSNSSHQTYENCIPPDSSILEKLNQPLPRYTSYPTTPQWHKLSPYLYEKKLSYFQETTKPLSLYFHIPFCRNICLFCGCSVVLNRNSDRQEKYVSYLSKEIDLITHHIGKSRSVHQIHFGGGTPTQLTQLQMENLFKSISRSFSVDFQKEVAIEIDPRTVSMDKGRKLRFLKDLGFNRISFGIQDTNPRVQEAIRRRQSREQSQQTYLLAREIGFENINIDLIYGLPFQNRDSFSQTIADVLTLRPQRISMYSFAHTPWLKLHQKALPKNSLPTVEEKFQIYTQARQQLIEGGYLTIGMDHFVLHNDHMAHAYFNKKLQRNFQGYSVKHSDDLIGLGITSTGYVENAYFQNMKNLKDYYLSLDQGKLPIFQGKILNKDDRIRKWTIHSLMCHFHLEKEEFFSLFQEDFDRYFSKESQTLQQLAQKGLLHNNSQSLTPTQHGKLFIRNIVSIFDVYLKQKRTSNRYSNAI